MKKKLFAAVICAVMSLVCLATFVACGSAVAYAESEPSEESSTFELPQGSRPDYESLFTDDQQSLIDKAVSGEATTEEMKEAIWVLYSTANKSRIQTENSLVVQESNAGISMADIVMHAYNLRIGDKWYYQLATSVQPNSDDLGAQLLAKASAAFAGYVKVAYTLGDGDYWFFAGKGEEYSCDCSLTTFPYAIVEIQEKDHAFETPYTLEEFNNKVHVLSDSIHEICNIDFEYVDFYDGDEDIEISFEDGVYRVVFSVNVNDSGENWYRKAQEDMQEGGQSIKSYRYYDVVLEVWDNGYAKSFHSESDRDAGTASGKPVDSFSYIWNMDEIAALVLQDKAANISREIIEGEETITLSDAEVVDAYFVYATTPKFVNTSGLGMFEIIGIVVGCIAFVVIAIVVTIEVLVKVGKLPKLAQKRADKKAIRALKKAQKANEKINEGDAVASKPVEPIDTEFAVDEKEVASDEE